MIVRVWNGDQFIQFLKDIGGVGQTKNKSKGVVSYSSSASLRVRKKGSRFATIVNGLQ